MMSERWTAEKASQVLAVVARLVARNAELERRLAEATSRARKNEGISSAQLLLLLDGLAAANEDALKSADEQLREASGIDAKRDEEPTTREVKRPRAKKPFPNHLRRVENVIPVPASERRCPKCGAERKCIGHDVSEVVELIPAEVVVRVDKREKLACAAWTASWPGLLPERRWCRAAWWGRRWPRRCWWTSTTAACRCTARRSASRGWASMFPSRRSRTR